MPANRSSASRASARRILDRLRALRGEPARQAEFAAESLEGQTDPEVLLALLEVLAAHPRPAAREAVLAALATLERDPRRRDPGGFARAAALRALAPIASHADTDAFLGATRIYEPSAQDGSAPGVLRAAGLAGLALLDDREAAVAAVRLLADIRHTSAMNGEPALTAVRVLAAVGEVHALYLFVLTEPSPHAEVVGEALKGLTDGPASLVQHAAGQFAGDAREVVLLGLCDLLVGHRADGALLPAAGRLLRGEAPIDVYAYFVTAIVASRHPPLVAELLAAAREERRPAQLAALADALPLLAGPEAAAVARDVAAHSRPHSMDPSAAESR